MRPVDKEDFALNKIRKGNIATIDRGAKAPSTTQISDGLVRECLDYYDLRYEKAYGRKPVYRSYNEAKTTMRDILRMAAADKFLVLRMIDAYIGDTNQYFKDRRHVLDVFKENVQPIAAAASLATKAPPEVIRYKIHTDTRCSGCGEKSIVECFPEELGEWFCSKCKLSL